MILNNKALEAAQKAFVFGGPSGVLRSVQHVDSYPGERIAPDDLPDPESHRKLPTTIADQDRAIEDIIKAYLEADQ